MVKAQASTLIARPAAQVYNFIAVDFLKNYQRWSPDVDGAQSVVRNIKRLIETEIPGD